MIKYLVLTVIFLVPLSAQADEAVFKMDGKTYKESDLDPATRQSIFDVRRRSHAQIEALLDEALLKKYFEQLAKKKKKTPEEVELEELKVSDPTGKEIKKFYEENKGRIPPNYTYEMVKPEIEKMLSQQRRNEKRQKLTEKVKKEKKYDFLLNAPEAPVISVKTEGFPSKGNSKAKVKIVEFADYQCPHCKEASEHFGKLMKEYNKKVELVFIDFPINRSGISRVVAEGGYCAMKQDKYWQYHEMAFKEQNKLSKESPKEFAKRLKLDTKAFDKCLGSAAAKEFVSRGKNEGDRVGVGGTPTIFINGKKLTSSYEYESLKKEVDKLL